MKDNFWKGMALGLVVGVVIIAYSKDAQRLVEKGKKLVGKKVEEMKSEQ